MHTLTRTAAFFFLLLLAACESAQDEIDRKTAAAQKQGAAPIQPDGQAVFRQNCVVCHGADGKLGLNGAKDLSQSQLTLEARVAQVTNGKNLMPPFGKQLRPEEIKAVAEYTLSFKK